LHKWLQAIYLCGCRELRSSLLSVILGVSFKTAAFMVDRIRYANSSFDRSIDASDVLEDVTNYGLYGGGRNEQAARFFDPTGKQTIHEKESDRLQFDRFLLAADRFRGHNLSDKFGTTFGKVAKARLKLRIWRKERTSSELV
jgi:hypothetical protein